MKLLIITQKVDQNDPILGFFHRWIMEFSKHCEKVTVICLQKREYHLPDNVQVLSLGKEKQLQERTSLKSSKRPVLEEQFSKIKYIWNFYRYIWQERKNYDSVFVHMNQEYILLGSPIWHLRGRNIYMWRNHGMGNFLTCLASYLCKKVFCTSTESYTAKFKNTVIMPVGVDTNIFKPIVSVIRKKYSICMVGRISPPKHVDDTLKAVNLLIKSGVQVTFDIIGPRPERDSEYYNMLEKYIVDNELSSSVRILPSVTHDKLPAIYSSYEICINLSQSGMFDKTILESSACGTIPLVSNPALSGVPKEVCISGSHIEDIADTIRMALEPTYQSVVKEKLQHFVELHSLKALGDKLFEEMK